MAWRWYKRLRLFAGVNANLSQNGIGWSWGIGIIRFGVSPNSKRWISIGIPGTGFRYFKYLKNNPQRLDQPHVEEDMFVNEEPEQPQKSIRRWKNLK